MTKIDIDELVRMNCAGHACDPDKCMVMNAESGCTCAMNAAALVSQAETIARLTDALEEIVGGASPDHHVPQYQHCVDVARAALEPRP